MKKKSREEKLERRRQWRLENAEKVRAQNAVSREKHREKNNKIQNERRAAKRAEELAKLPPPEFTKEELAEKRRIANAEYKKRWRLENIDRIREKRKAKYHSEKEIAIIKAVEWGRKNPEKRKSIVKNYEENNPELIKASRNKRRAAAKNAEGSHTPEDIQELFVLQGGLCAIGGMRLPKKYHVDHTQPLALGGSNWPSNLQLTCPRCNLKKGKKEPLSFFIDFNQRCDGSPRT